MTSALAMLSSISSILIGLRILSAASVPVQHNQGGGKSQKRQSARHLVPSYIDEKLSKAILEDVLPPISSTCGAVLEPDVYTTTFNFTFSSSQSTSQWSLDAVDVEEYAFLVEMGHNDTINTDQAWRMRLGRGGNVYSFVGAYGEAIPPQKRGDSPWVDEVWQSVAVNTELNGKDDSPYFVHQAGTYDGPEHDDLKIPFYSPTIAVHCEGHSCSVASWGQHAHIPTKFESSLVYINRYTNCNNGVIEITSLIHNFGDHENMYDRLLSHEVDFLNIPWGGVRSSTLPALLLSSPPSSILRADNRNTKLNPLNPIPLFGGEGGSVPNIAQSGGATVFAQDHYHKDYEDYNNPSFNLPCGVQRDRVITNARAVPCHYGSASPLQLKIRDDDACQESPSHTEMYGFRVIFCNLEETVEIKDSCLDCNLKLINPQTKANFLVKGVIHWSFVKTRFYFLVDDDVTEDIVNNVFREGDLIYVERYENGVSYDDALSLAFVHGRDLKDESGGQHSQIEHSFIRFGRSGSYARDYIVFVAIIRALVKANQTYIKRHYIVTDRLHSMQEERLNALSDATYQNIEEADDLGGVGRSITLYGTSDFQWFNVALDEDEMYDCASVPNNDVVEICQGWTTPRLGSTKLLYIRCGDEHHVGEDFYYFADDDAKDDIVRPYVCEDAENEKPEILWLGFFPRGACDQLTNAQMDPTLCDIYTGTDTETDTDAEPEMETETEPEVSDEIEASQNSFYPTEVVEAAINQYLQPPSTSSSTTTGEADMAGIDVNPFRNRVRQPVSFDRMIDPVTETDADVLSYSDKSSSAAMRFHYERITLVIALSVLGLSTAFIADYI